MNRGKEYRVTLQVQFAPVVLRLSNHTGDSLLQGALADAANQPAGTGNFVDRFAEAFEKRNPGVSLAPLFVKPTNGSISYNSAKAEGISFLKRETEVAAKRTGFIISERLKMIGSGTPQCDVNESAGVINTVFSSNYPVGRLRSYLEANGKLEFYETYTNNEIGPLLFSVNKVLGELEASSEGTTKRQKNRKPIKDTTSLSYYNKRDKEREADSAAHSPLFKIMEPYLNIDGNSFVPGPIVGFLLSKDAPIFFTLMNRPQVRDVLPKDVRFCLSPPDEKAPNSSRFVYAIKVPPGGEAGLDGSHITKARADYNPADGKPDVTMDMDQTGTRLWAAFTGYNVGGYIAVVLDSTVYSCPRVYNQINGGSTQISGAFTVEQAVDLANVLMSGSLAAPVVITEISGGK